MANKKSIVAVEVTEEHVRAAEIKNPRSTSPTVVAYHEKVLPAGVASDSEVYAPELLASTLNELWSEAEFSTKRVVLGISNRKIMFRPLEVPYLPLEKVRKNLAFEASDMIPAAMGEPVMDFYPSHKVEDKELLSGILVVVASDTISNLTTAFGIADLIVENVDLSAFGLIRAVQKAQRDETVSNPEITDYMIIDVRTSNSVLIAVKNNVPSMIRPIPNGVRTRERIGGSRVFRDDEQDEEEEEEQVEELSLDTTSQSVLEDTSEGVPAFLSEVINTLNYNRQNRPEKIYITGEGSVSEYLKAGIRQHINIPTEELTVEKITSTPLPKEKGGLFKGLSKMNKEGEGGADDDAGKSDKKKGSKKEPKQVSNFLSEAAEEEKRKKKEQQKAEQEEKQRLKQEKKEAKERAKSERREQRQAEKQRRKKQKFEKKAVEDETPDENVLPTADADDVAKKTNSLRLPDLDFDYDPPKPPEDVTADNDALAESSAENSLEASSSREDEAKVLESNSEREATGDAVSSVDNTDDNTGSESAADAQKERALKRRKEKQRRAEKNKTPIRTPTDINAEKYGQHAHITAAAIVSTIGNGFRSEKV